MARPELKSELRKETGSASSRRMRRAEVIPSVVDGGKKPSRAVTVSLADIMKLGHGTSIENMMLDLKLGGGEKGESEAVLVKQVQYDPVTGALIHIDFNAISLHEKITVDVSIEETGEALGVTQQGGVLEHLMRTIRVACLPGDIPEQITMDISAMEIGDSLYVKDVVSPPGVAIIDDMNLPIFSVSAPRVEEEVEAAPEEEAVAATEEEAGAAPEKAEEKPEREAEKKKE